MFGEKHRAAIRRMISRTTIKDLGYKTECWIAGGWNSGNGYAKISIGGISWMVHRFSYTYFVMPLRQNQQVDHRCCSRACWNPDHLQAVTNLKNQKLKAKRNRRKKREAARR